MNRFIRLKPILQWLVRLFGMQIRDISTGKPLGKFLFVPWRGSIFVFGLGTTHDEPFQPVFRTQARISYAVQQLGFQQWPAPDYPHERHLAHPPDA